MTAKSAGPILRTLIILFFVSFLFLAAPPASFGNPGRADSPVHVTNGTTVDSKGTVRTPPFDLAAAPPRAADGAGSARSADSKDRAPTAAANTASTVGSGWRPIGPNPIAVNSSFTWGVAPFSGRVTSMAINDSNPSEVYIGTAGGGIWRTLDDGSTWTPLTDDQSTLAIGSLTISPDSKIIYAGTGEANHGGDTYSGKGILESTDSGRTWTLLGASVFDGLAISSMVINPVYPKQIFAATAIGVCCRGLGYAPNTGLAVGIYLSTDGGNSWTLTVNAQGSWGHGVASMVVVPANFQFVGYVSFVEAADYSGLVWGYSISGNDLNDWTLGTWNYQLSNPQVLQCQSVGPICRGALAATPAMPASVYVAFTNATGGFGGIYRYDITSNQKYSMGQPPGGTRTTTAFGPAPWNPCGTNQGWYDLLLAVDPSDPNVAYYGCTELYRTLDGGGTWTDLGGYSALPLHPDQHAFAFRPGSSATVFVGNDGGVWKSTDRGTTWTNLNRGLGITQFYQIGVPRNSNGFLIGGTQDNGCNVYAGSTSWTLVKTGDGTWAGVDPQNSQTLYCSFPYAAGFARSLDGGKTWQAASNGTNTKEPSRFDAPAAQDPNNHCTLYLGTVRIYKSWDCAGTWQDVSGALAKVPFSAIAVAPSDSNVIYAGDGNGTLFASTDAGGTWNRLFQITTKAGAGAGIASISVSPTDSKVAFVAAANFETPTLVEVLNGGTSIHEVPTVGLPGLSINVVIADRATGAIFIGTDGGGVFFSTDVGNTWAKLGSGLPNTPIFDMAMGQTALLVATHGRGVWMLDLRGAFSVKEELSVGISGGGAGYSLPVLTYLSNGVVQTSSLSLSPVSLTIDYGTVWNVTRVLQGSTASERWATPTPSGVAGIVPPHIIYYHQYLVDFESTYVGQAPASSPLVAVTSFGQVKNDSSGNNWADAGSNYVYESPTSSSSSSQRWTTGTPSGAVSSSASLVSAVYYHQYAESYAFSFVGGGAPNAPTLSYRSLGSRVNVSLTRANTVWADEGSSWVVESSVNGSTGGERWSTPSPSSGSFTSARNSTLIYYHQYSLNVAFSVLGGGDPPSAPALSYISFANHSELTLTTAAKILWADAGSSYSVPASLSSPTSAPSERWSTSVTLMSVGQPGQSVFQYYHQFPFTLSYSVSGRGGPPSPALISTQFGSHYSSTLGSSPGVFWLDAGSAWSVQNPLSGSNLTERWYAQGPTNGTVGNALQSALVFSHQYHVLLSSQPSAGGTVTPGSGWFDENTALKVSASAAPGWQFEGWSGKDIVSQSSNATGLSLIVGGPKEGQALFYPGLTISATGGGKVTFTYGTEVGTVQDGATRTLYVAPGTSVSLGAEPSSSLSVFQGWSGAGVTSTPGGAVIVVNAPTDITGAFAINLAVVGVAAAAVSAAVAGAALIMKRRGRRMP